MLGPSWIALLQRIPSNLHDCLALLTTTGVEVVVQRLLRMEEHFLVLRGRVAGSLDAGRVMIVPYDQISNVAFNKRMSEEEVQQIFEGSEGAVSLAPSPPAEKKDAAEETRTDPQAGSPKEPEVSPAKEPEAKPAKAPHPSKSVLLERLRARLAEKSTQLAK